MIVLVRHDVDPPERYVTLFHATPAAASAPEKALRAAVADYAKDAEAIEAMLKARDISREDFNWGDAILDVPDEVWERHGLVLLDDAALKVVEVDQDERLLVGEDE